jgi:hypothetical protein
MQYPKSFIPNAVEPISAKNGVIEVPNVQLTFKPWTGEPLADTWGGKATIDYGGVPMFAELALMHIAIDDGWNARWLETYSMKHGVPFQFMAWTGRPLEQKESELIADARQLRLLESVAAANGTYYGCWDVIVWHNDRTIFIESKRHKADKIRDTQVRWLESGLAAGLNPDDFLIAQWDFARS